MPHPFPDRQYLLTAALLFILLIPLAYADDIVVVTDSLHPVHAPAAVRVITLDRPAYLKARLAAQLPPNTNQSMLLVKQRLKEGGTPLQQQFGTAYQDVVNAWALGVTKIPAVVVDRRFVVYGEPDVAKAIALIEKFQGEQP